MEAKKKKNISFSEFIQKVRRILLRHTLKGWAVLLAVLRRLRERGIWPWSRNRTAEEVCPTVQKEMQKEMESEGKKNDDRNLHKVTTPVAAKTQAKTKNMDTFHTDKSDHSPYSAQIQSLTREARTALCALYDLRYNVLEGQAEIRRKGHEGMTTGEFRAVTPQVLNTLVLRLHEEGLPVWDRDVQRLLCSLEPKQYHPIAEYLDHLPAWDGRDRIGELAARISTEELWMRVFRIWMRGMVRQWTLVTAPSGQTYDGCNQLSPVLISAEQGLHKSTFCRMLLPPELSALYTDKFELGGKQNLEFPLCRYALVNLDEFDRFSTAQMGKLKNLMQLGRMNVRRPHATHFESMQRTASFIGTSNTTELLTDPTGSRRFFCQEVTEAIDCTTPVDHGQLYAQILSELSTGMPYYLSKADEQAVQHHNRRYYRASALREAFLTLFRKPTVDDGEHRAEWLTATEIYRHLQQHFGAHIVSGTPLRLGLQLTFLGLEKRHTERGNEYRVERNG